MVQGETMGKRKRRIGKGTLPAVRLLAIGFLLGILIPNVIWKLEWRQKTLASVYILGIFAGKSMEGAEYFWYVLRMRGSVFLVAAFCGVSVFGVPLSVLGMLIQGLEIGLILTMSILQFGLAGGAVGAGLFLPQYLLYIPSVCLLLSVVYMQSLDIWKNRGLFPQKVYRYVLAVLPAGALYFGGILLEVYCNPWVFHLFTKNSYLF